ncbi:MAG: helix-turn-helix transcriptional regulator [Eubacterium sp.]|nr:helix-turn-helix transcriptional regulator [Eubacterium sp.]
MPDINAELTKTIFSERENDIKHPSFDSEMGLYNLIAEGKTEEAKRTMERQPKYTAVERGILSDNPLRNAMYHFVAMTAVLTRVCIMKGMPQDIAYKMSDVFINKADKQNSPEAVARVQVEMAESFSEYMNNASKSVIQSKQILQCIDYIRENIHKNITVSELADKVALNETYLSKLFKKEVGNSVSEYIRNEKIQEACWLLKYTDKTSIEIATDLSFSSHSYFISVFKKVTGTTPKEYRNTNYRELI